LSLLTFCQDIARDAGTNVPATLVGNTDLTAIRLLTAAKNAGQFLFRKHNWSALIREHEITTAASTASYALPAGYHNYINDTAWDRSTYWQMRGSMSPHQWQILKSGLVQAAGLRKRFRVKWDTDNNARRVFIEPTPSSVETLVIEFVSQYWCSSSGGTPQTAWAADGDLPLLDPWLFECETKWRFLKSEGQPYAEEKLEAMDTLNLQIAQDAPADTLIMGDGSEEFDPFEGGVNIPDSGYGM